MIFNRTTGLILDDNVIKHLLSFYLYFCSDPIWVKSRNCLVDTNVFLFIYFDMQIFYQIKLRRLDS